MVSWTGRHQKEAGACFVLHQTFVAEPDASRQQLKSWFRWRQSNLTHGNGSRQATVQLGDVLGLPTKASTRALSRVQKYSSLYYPTRVAQTVAADLAGLGRPPSHAETLSTIKRATQEAWDAEDQDTRAIVDQALADDRAKKDQAANAKAVAGGEKTPADYQT